MSEQVLVWAREWKPKEAQSAIITSLSETKEFDKIKTIKGGQRHILRKPQTHTQMPVMQSCSYCGTSHPPRKCWALGRKVQSVARPTTLQRLRSSRNRTVHDIEQEPDQHYEEDHIDTVNINSIIFNSKWSVITANLKTLSNHVSIILSYKVDRQ